MRSDPNCFYSVGAGACAKLPLPQVWRFNENIKPFIGGYFKISGGCVLLSLTLQSWVLKLMYDAGMREVLPGLVVAILGGTGLYFLLYKLASWTYERWLWRSLYRSLNIDGTWYHVIESASKRD